MHIAILLAGHVNKAMTRRFGDYHDMFKVLFQSLPNGQNFRLTTLAVVGDIFPNHPDDYEGYLMLCSAYCIYNDALCIARLIDLIQQIHEARKPLFGVCFGHQIIARTLGDCAQKWYKRMVLGSIEVTLTNLPSWIAEKDFIVAKNVTINLIHVHQDQVTKLPEGAVRIGAARDCKNAVFIIGDRVFAIQGYPVFEIPYTNALLSLLKDWARKSHVRAARKLLSKPHDGRRLASWILAFFSRPKPTHWKQGLVRYLKSHQTVENENNQNVTCDRP